MAIDKAQTYYETELVSADTVLAQHYNVLW